MNISVLFDNIHSGFFFFFTLPDFELAIFEQL